MGPDYVDFTFAFNTTIIRLKLTDIYLYYVAQGFLPPPVPNVHNRGVVPDRVNQDLLSRLLNRSVQYKLNDVNSVLKPCITPDCPGLFVKSLDTDETNCLDHTLCRLCGVKICPR